MLPFPTDEGSPELSQGPINFYFKCKPETGNEPRAEPGIELGIEPEPGIEPGIELGIEPEPRIDPKPGVEAKPEHKPGLYLLSFVQ